MIFCAYGEDIDQILSLQVWRQTSGGPTETFQHENRYEEVKAKKKCLFVKFEGSIWSDDCHKDYYPVCGRKSYLHSYSHIYTMTESTWSKVLNLAQLTPLLYRHQHLHSTLAPLPVHNPGSQTADMTRREKHAYFPGTNPANGSWVVQIPGILMIRGVRPR